MLSETRGIEMAYRTEAIDRPKSWRYYADFGGDSASVHPAKPVVSRPVHRHRNKTGQPIVFVS